MKLGIMQPYFMPYIGYFQLMKAVDKYVIYNDVNYINRGWVARNNILISGKKQLFTISLQGASQNKHFTEIQVLDNFRKLVKTLDMNYSKAPFFQSTMGVMEKIFSYPERRLDFFIKNSFEQILFYLGIKTELILSSNLNKDDSLKGQNKILEICKILKADTYYNAIGGKELYDKEVFEDNGISLHFLKTDENLRYTQFPNMEFVPNLSIIDVLMFNSVEEVNKMLDDYTLE